MPLQKLFLLNNCNVKEIEMKSHLSILLPRDENMCHFADMSLDKK